MVTDGRWSVRPGTELGVAKFRMADYYPAIGNCLPFPALFLESGR
jgi:hypothetical protein